MTKTRPSWLPRGLRNQLAALDAEPPTYPAAPRPDLDHILTLARTGAADAGPAFFSLDGRSAADSERRPFAPFDGGRSGRARVRLGVLCAVVLVVRVAVALAVMARPDAHSVPSGPTLRDTPCTT